MPNHRIRNARPGDEGEIFAMVCELAEYEEARHEVLSSEQLFAEALFCEEPAVWCSIVEHPSGEDWEVAGMAVWFVNFHTWTAQHSIWLDDLYVRERYRGLGYGRALLQHLAETCVERGYPRLDWWVLDWNEHAIGFYRSLGVVGMDEWTVQRLTGPALEQLASGD